MSKEYDFEVEKVLGLAKRVAVGCVENSILLSLIKKRGLAYQILVGDFCVDVVSLESELVSSIKFGKSGFFRIPDNVLFSAEKFSEKYGFLKIGEESLLYGLLDVKSSASKLLFEYGVDLNEFVLGVDVRCGFNNGIFNRSYQLIDIKVDLESLFDDEQETVVEGNILDMSEKEVMLFRSGALNVKSSFGKYKRIKDSAKIVDGRPYWFLEYIRRGN